MTKGAKLQKKISEGFNTGDEDIRDEMYKLSYDFKIELLVKNGWVKIGITTDGLNNEIYQHNSNKETFCLINSCGTFCFTTDPTKASYWFKSEIIFETIMENLF